MSSPASADAARRATELRALLERANHAYYVLDQPTVDDIVYDEGGDPHGPRSSSTLASVIALKETMVSVIAAARAGVVD